MKLFVVGILSMVILMSTSTQAITYLSWKINQTTIARTLCIKKNIKGNSCQGKCHLKLQLETSDDNDRSTIPIESEIITMLLYCVNLENLTINYILDNTQSNTPNTYNVYIDRKIAHRMLRPPQLIS